MIPLDVPVPPQLEQATGYHGDALRYFALYWQPCGDESMYDDGRHSGTGCWSGYLAWIRHPAAALELAPYNLGSSDQEAEYWLLIDRHSRKAYAAPVPEARRVLHQQWPAVEPAVLSEAEWAALLGRLQVEFAARPMPSMAEIEALMREQRRLETEMVAWLDGTPQTPQALKATGPRRPAGSPQAPDVPVPPPGNDLAAVAEWATGVMRAFGLDGWRFQYNKQLTTTGLCRHFHRVIELSVHFVRRNPGPELRDAVLHEIAHALVGRGHGHDDIWRAKAVEVGARPERCGQADMPAGRWQATCNGCGATHDRHRRPSRPLFCRECGWEKGKLTWASI